MEQPHPRLLTDTYSLARTLSQPTDTKNTSHLGTCTPAQVCALDARLLASSVGCRRRNYWGTTVPRERKETEGRMRILPPLSRWPNEPGRPLGREETEGRITPERHRL